MTDGVDGKTGLPNQKAVSYDSDMSRATSAAIAGGFVGAGFLGTTSAPFNGLFVFMLKNDKDPASIPKLIYLFEKPFDEKLITQKSIEYGKKARTDVREATKNVVDDLKKKYSVDYQPGAYYLQDTEQDFCHKEYGCLISEYKEFSIPGKDILNPKVGSALPYLGKDEVFYSVSNNYITQKLNKDNYIVDINSTKFNPLRDFYIPVSEQLAENAYWYLPASYSTTGYTIMLNKGTALQWDVPATKPHN